MAKQKRSVSPAEYRLLIPATQNKHSGVEEKTELRGICGNRFKLQVAINTAEFFRKRGLPEPYGDFRQAYIS